MLIAIAIYKTNPEHNKFQKIKYAQRDAALFPRNPLENIEKNILPKFFLESFPNEIYFFQHNGEYYYIQSLAEKSIFAVILSKKKLDRSELIHLFANIEIIYTKPEVKTTLDHIMINPLGYTGRYILITEIQEQLDELKTILMNDLDKLIIRGEQIEDLQKKTLLLHADSAAFVIETKKLNRCCNMF